MSAKIANKSTLTTEDVAHIARLASLPLSEKELVMFASQLDETLGYIAMLNELDTKDVEPTNQVTGLQTVLRTDIAAPSLPSQDALKNAKRTQDGFFQVQAVFEQ